MIHRAFHEIAAIPGNKIIQLDLIMGMHRTGILRGAVDLVMALEIIGRKLKCFRVEDKKEIAMPPQNKEIGFGDQTMACPNCGQSAIVNPFRKDREIYPYCPWCGQKLKEAEDEQAE